MPLYNSPYSDPEKAKVIMAFENWVKTPKLTAYRIALAEKQKCPITGVPITYQNANVHYKQPLSLWAILKAFLDIKGLTLDSSLVQSRISGTRQRVLVPAQSLQFEWATFHRKYAEYQVTSSNAKYPRRDDIADAVAAEIVKREKAQAPT